MVLSLWSHIKGFLYKHCTPLQRHGPMRWLKWFPSYYCQIFFSFMPFAWLLQIVPWVCKIVILESFTRGVYNTTPLGWGGCSRDVLISYGNGMVLYPIKSGISLWTVMALGSQGAHYSVNGGFLESLLWAVFAIAYPGDSLISSFSGCYGWRKEEGGGNNEDELVLFCFFISGRGGSDLSV